MRAVERRISALVLMAGSYSWFARVDSKDPDIIALKKQVGEERLKKYVEEYRWQDPVNYVGHSAPAASLLRFPLGPPHRTLTAGREGHCPQAYRIYPGLRLLLARAQLGPPDYAPEPRICQVATSVLSHPILDNGDAGRFPSPWPSLPRGPSRGERSVGSRLPPSPPWAQGGEGSGFEFDSPISTLRERGRG